MSEKQLDSVRRKINVFFKKQIKKEKNIIKEIKFPSDIKNSKNEQSKTVLNK